MGRWGRAAALLALLVAPLWGGLLACSGDDDGDDTKAEDEKSEDEKPLDKDALKAELLEMSAADQAERTGQAPAGGGVNNDQVRAGRLAEIIDEYGWPTFDMVGKDGATAAWVIAQHADYDVEFQKRVLKLLEEAVDAEQGDPTEWAYLVDRVATNENRPQTYGTQMACVNGKAEPRAIEDQANVDTRRAEVDLAPLADYLAEMNAICADEAGAGSG